MREKCIQCGEQIPLSELRHHIQRCLFKRFVESFRSMTSVICCMCPGPVILLQHHNLENISFFCSIADESLPSDDDFQSTRPTIQEHSPTISVPSSESEKEEV